MTAKSRDTKGHKPNFIAIGLILGCCFMVAMESPAPIIFGVMLGIALDWRQRKAKS